MTSEYTERFRPSSEGSAQTWRGEYAQDHASPTEAALQFLRDYSRERPETVALWAFGLGFVLAWKLKPW